jgi:alpha,alpha-trehalase
MKQDDKALKTFYRDWTELDANIQKWWNTDLRKSQEDELLDSSINKIWYADEEHQKNEEMANEPPTLLYLPFPYISGGGSESAFPEMYCWDIYFVNLGLLAHQRYDIVRYHILNQLFMIERYGMVLNGNRTFYLGRSQLPLHAVSVENYYRHTKERDMLFRAYPILKKEFINYWKADHHHTQTGLATNRDLSDPELPSSDIPKSLLQQARLRPELSAEAEVLDFTSIFDGDVRQCNPLMTNCALIRYAKTLKWMAGEIGLKADSRFWDQEARDRSSRLNELCWNEETGFYFEYNYKRETQLPYWSLSAYWTLWAGIANKKQARRLLENLIRFEHPYGLSQTDKIYPSPHPEFEYLQWDYPSGWAPMHMIICDALSAYGYSQQAIRIAQKFLTLQIDIYKTTNKLWEKYNCVNGSLELPRERYPVVPLHGWSSASVVYLGRKIFESSVGHV